MRAIKKIPVFLLTMILCIGLMAMPAFAASSSQDGLEVTLTTDKESYSQSEQIVASLTVTNTNDFAVSNVSLENVIPEGYTLAEGNEATKQVESLEAGETVSLTVTYVPEDTGEQPDAGDDTGDTDTPSSGDNGGSTEQPGTGNDSGSGSNTGTGDNNSTSGNGTSGSGSNNSGTSPTTGDDSNVALWIALLVLACGGIVTLIALRKKSGKKLLSLFLCVAMVGSLATGVSTKAYAEENSSSSINIETVVSVEGEDLTLKGVVNYEIINAPIDEGTLSNFAADESYFIANFESVITFTVNVNNSTDVVNLCSGSDDILGEMHDDGINGDVVANDGIYTYTLTANYPEGVVEFYAKSGDSISNAESVEFFSRPTEEMRDTAEEIQQNLNSINSKYTDEDGTMPAENVDIALAEAIEYAELLVSEGKISDYEVTENSVVYNLPSGLTLLFSPRIEGTYTIGSDISITIYTFQPLYDWVHGQQNTYLNLPSGVNNEADLIPAAANALSNKFDNCLYSSATATRNQDITLSDIKGIGANQIVLWQGHGSWAGDKIHSVLLTNGAFDWNAWFWNPIYFIDCCAKRIVNQNGWESVSSKYIDHYCGNMDNTYIYLGPCESGHDSVLAQAFLNKGASAVIGNTHSVRCLYGDLMEYTSTKLLAEVNPNTGNYYTLGEALSKAKELYGTNDSRYGGYGAEPILFGGNTAQNYRLADVQTGTLSGKICKASDRTSPVGGANIYVYKDDVLCKAISADSSGNYSMMLPEGDYRIEIMASGYITFTSYATVSVNENTYMETFLLIEGSEGETGIASGNIYNALTGSGIEEVTLTIRKGWNNAEIGDVVATTTTESNGAYSVALPLGNYTMYATKDGYISTTVNIIVQEGTTSAQNGTMTPIISGDSFRIVLTWGENPRDLDSHVEGTLSSGTSFHVYYGHESQYDGDVEVCNLDVDDTTSYGPETITLNTVSDNPYYYYIYRFAGSGTVASSGAQIKVYQGENLVATFNVPTDQGTGDYWNVFAIVDGELIVKNTITSSKDTSYATATESSQIVTFSNIDGQVDKTDESNTSAEVSKYEDQELTLVPAVDNEAAEATSELAVEVENQGVESTYKPEINSTETDEILSDNLSEDEELVSEDASES